MGQNDLEQVNVLIRGIISMTNSPNMTSIISLKFNKSGQICKFDYNDRKPNEIEPLLYKQPLLIRMNTEKGNLLKDTPFFYARNRTRKRTNKISAYRKKQLKSLTGWK